MTINLTRRAACAGAAAVAFPPILDAATAPDPFLPIYHELLAVEEMWANFPRDLSLEEDEALNDVTLDRWRDAIHKASATRPTTQEGLAALAHIAWMEAGPTGKADSADFDQEAAQVEHRLLAHVWRSLTGLEGLPRVLL